MEEFHILVLHLIKVDTLITIFDSRIVKNALFANKYRDLISADS